MGNGKGRFFISSLFPSSSSIFLLGSLLWCCDHHSMKIRACKWSCASAWLPTCTLPSCRLSSMSASICTYLTCTCARKRISRSSLVRHRHRHRHKYRVTNQKKAIHCWRHSCVSETHKTTRLEYARQSATRRRESGERERERERPKLYTVVRETQRISRILFFLFSPPFSHHSHTNGVNKAFFPSGATTYAAVLALRPGTEPCDHQPPCLPT